MTSSAPITPLQQQHANMSQEEIDEMAYLPGSGPTLEYPYGHPSQQPGFVTAFWNPYEVKHRRRTSRSQLAVLEREFDNDPKPNADKRRALAAQLNMTPRAIQVWFQNRRAKIKAVKNKIPGGRGMPKLKPGDRAAARATRSIAHSAPESDDDEDDEKPDLGNGTGQWIQLQAASPLISPIHPSPSFSSDPPIVMSPESEEMTPPASTMPKPHFTIAVPPSDATSGPNSAHSAHSGPPSPDFMAPPHLPPSSEYLAPPSPQTLLRRGSAPAPLQGIHRARYSAFNNSANNVNRQSEFPPVSPISPPDHDVAPLRRGSMVNLSRRPSLPDSHLRLPAHPYYAHPAPRMQRRGGLLSPVPDVQEQEQTPHVPYSLSIPTVLPPAPQPSRMYRALPPGMGASPVAHDLPTQFPARPTLHAPARPFAVPVAGPLPAADFSFGAPEPGHGDAFNRAMEGQEGEMHSNEYNSSNPDFHSSNPDFHTSNPDFHSSNPDFHSSNPDFHASNPDFHSNSNNTNDYLSSSPNTEFNPSSAASEFAPPGPNMWDARTRFGSMASIASDVTGVSVSSTQATSVSGGLGTAGCENYGDLRNFGDSRNGFGDSRNGFGDSRNGFADARNGGFGDGRNGGFGNFGYGCPTGFQPDMRRASCPGEFLHQFSGMGMNTTDPGPRSTSMNMRPSPLGRSLTIAPDAPMQNNNNNHRGLTLSPDTHRPVGLNLDGHRSNVNLALEAKTLRSPTFPPGQVDPTFPPPPPGPSVADRGPFAPKDQQQHSPEPYHSPQTGMTPAQRALVGGGFGSDPGFIGGGYVDEMRTPPEGGMERMHSNGMENMHHNGMGSSGQASPMLFTGVGVEGDPSFDLNAMNPDTLAMTMIGQEYGMPGANEFAFP